MDTKWLSSLGLEEKSAKIYLAGLSLGTTSVQELARKSGLKRPTVYVHLDELLKQGFFEHVAINYKRYYRAADPHLLEERLKRSLSVLQTELPKLVSLRASTIGRPEVQIFEGEEGMLRVYEEIKNANSICFWSNIGKTYMPFHNMYMEICEAIRESGAGAREIIADTKESKRYSRLLAKITGPTYRARIATVDGLENDTAVFGNIVVLFRLHGTNMFVVRIEDMSIAGTMRAMFDMAWKTARPF